MLLGALLLASLQAMRLPVAEAETLQVTIQGSGEAVVLLPGLFGSAFGYRRVVPMLIDSGYRTIVIEPLGMGTSSRPAGADYSLTAQADRVAAVLDSLRLGHVLIVAHSTSASIAMRLALRRAELVRGILSIDGGPAEEAAMPGFRRILRFAPLLRLFATRHRMEKMMHDNFIKSSGDTAWVTADVVAHYAAGATRDPGATLNAFKGMASSREPETLHAGLGRIRAPVHLLVGGAPHTGGITSEEITRLAAGLAAFSADTVAGAGHFIHEEQPEAVVAGVRRLAK